MGGKHKQGNRTKNNARPSSSSHSAELLGNTIPTFFGFSSIKDGVSTVTGFPVDNANYSISADFQIIFKQMNKKDPTTRFKALQMFVDVCNNSCVNAVQAILPLWPRMYCTLCTDVDHKVRESAHIAHHSVVSKVKKMIAPYLKELAGPWFISQYDTYAPAATAATLAFEEAFPSTKLNKAIVFCQEEILSYIFDNLINQTPQTLCNPNTTSSEDMQAKYERIVIASLQGYSLYLQKLSFEQIQEVEESNKKLISNQKFWKYSKNKTPLIRSSFFYVLITLCHKAKFLLNGESSRLSSAIFNNLDESDPVVLHAVWDAALNVLVSIEDCWSHINIEKQVFAKLSSLLKSGGRNVSTIYPNILPLLSKLPDEMIKDKKMFYGNLLNNMACGLDVSSYNPSNSENKVVANTFVVCLKYIIMRNSSDVDFCDFIVNTQLMSALERKLSANKSKKPQSTPFLTNTSCLVHYWHANRTANATYEKIFNDFFLSLFNLYSNQISSEVTVNTLSDILNNQIEFLRILLNPCQFLPKTKERVKFADESEEEKTSTNAHFESHNEDFAEEMLPLVKKLTIFYFKNAINNEDKTYIPAISKIVQLFDAKAIFEEMVTAVNESKCFKLFTSYFSKWLMNQNMKCGELVDLSFGLLKYVTNDEKEYILEEFCNNWFSDTLHFNICKALPNYSEDDSIIKWVRSEKFAKSILNLVERYIEGDGEDRTWQDIIVMLMQAKCANGEFIINLNTSGSVMDLVSNAISQDQVKPHVIELSQSLIVNAKIEQTKASSLEELVASLFKLWCYQPEDEEFVKACKTGLKIALSNCRKRNVESHLTKKLAEVVQEVTVSDKFEFLPDRIVSNINTYVELALNTNLSDSCSSNVEIAKAIVIVKMFLEVKPHWYEEGLKMVEKCCRVGFEGNEKVDFRYLRLENYLEKTNDFTCLCDWENYPRFDLNVVRKYAKWNLYSGSVLNLIARAHPRNYKTSVLSKGLKAYEFESESSNKDNNSGVTNEDDVIAVKLSRDEESKLRSDLDIIDSVFHEPEYDEVNTMKLLLGDINAFLLSVSLLDSFNNFYVSTNHYKELKNLIKKLKLVASDLLKNVNTVEFEFVYDQCRIFFREKSLWWLVRPSLKEIFNRNFIEFLNTNELDVAEAIFEEMNKIEIKNQSKHRGNYLILLGLMEKGFGHRFPEKQWGQIFVYIYDFFEEFLRESEFSNSHLLTLSAVARLYYKLKVTFAENHTKLPDFRIPPDTCLAWDEIVQTDIYNKFILTWRKLAKHAYNKKDIPPEWIIVLQNVSDVIIAALSLRKSESLQESVELEIECGHLMTSSHAVIQITAFQLCLSVIPDLVKLDTEIFGNQVTQMFQDTKDSSSLFKKSSNGNWTVKNLSGDILHNQGIVEILLSDFIVGDCCSVEPFTDSFTYTYSYLLLWCFLLDMCGEAHSPLRFQYGCWLQDAGYSNTFLESVFKLMPQMVLHGSEAKENCRKYFENYGSLDFRQPVESERIEQIACFVYRLFLQRLPNVIREWWNGVENKTSGLVDKVTRLYVSPILISNELRNVQQDRETGFDNMEVKTYPNSREVIATYTIDEVKMDLIMTLPQNYPLGTIKIESSNVVVSTSNWRNWLFHICKYLIHQNGTIWDALVIWKNNLDKKFEGVEECYICFSILQGATFEIPRLCCHTCKKKFHSNCLYKWFSTSNKSTCPICRNLF